MTTRSAASDSEVISPATTAIAAALDQYAFEDGMSHPAEPLISEFIQTYGESMLFGMVFVSGRGKPTQSAALLRLLGRERSITTAMRRRLVKAGLASESILLRDAAAQIADIWEDPALVPDLESHVESSPWLAKYIADVVCALKEARPAEPAMPVA